MITSFDVYLVMQADNLIGFLAVMTLASCLCLAILLIVKYGDEGKSFVVTSLHLWCTAVVITVCSLGLVITPSTTSLAAMYVVPRVANNEELPAKAAELYTTLIQRLKGATDVTESKP